MESGGLVESSRIQKQEVIKSTSSVTALSNLTPRKSSARRRGLLNGSKSVRAGGH